MIIHVDNIKCGGCANSINKKLLELDGITDVTIDIDEGAVTVQPEELSDNQRTEVIAALGAMGYPQKGTVDGMASVKAKATSYVSCAIGKFGE